MQGLGVKEGLLGAIGHGPEVLRKLRKGTSGLPLGARSMYMCSPDRQEGAGALQCDFQQDKAQKVQG